MNEGAAVQLPLHLFEPDYFLEGFDFSPAHRHFFFVAIVHPQEIRSMKPRDNFQYIINIDDILPVYTEKVALLQEALDFL